MRSTIAMRVPITNIQCFPFNNHGRQIDCASFWHAMAWYNILHTYIQPSTAHNSLYFHQFIILFILFFFLLFCLLYSVFMRWCGCAIFYNIYVWCLYHWWSCITCRTAIISGFVNGSEKCSPRHLFIIKPINFKSAPYPPRLAFEDIRQIEYFFCCTCLSKSVVLTELI